MRTEGTGSSTDTDQRLIQLDRMKGNEGAQFVQRLDLGHMD